jgi:hypothetical protein
MNAPDRTWILQEEDRIKSLMKKYQRNNCKEKLKNNNDNQRTQSSRRRSRVEFFSDGEKTVCRDDILDDVPRLSGILLPSFFVLPLSSSFPRSAAATPHNNFLQALADSAFVAGAAAGENSPDPARNPPLLEVKFQSRFVADCANVP